MARPHGSHSRRSGANAKVAWILFIVLVASRTRELLAAARGYGKDAHVGSRRWAGFISARWWPCGSGIRPRSGSAWGENAYCLPRIRMGVGAGGGDLGGPRPKQKRALGLLSTGINDAILEMCVENKGRPLARSMTDFVEYTIEALASGYSAEALLLELQFLDSTTRVPGQTLTGVEKRHRTQWIVAMHAVMQNLKYVEEQEPKSAEEFHIKSQVNVVLRGRMTNDEQTFVKFDKALATGGVDGGAATERIVISPQMVPISQLTLLAIRALQKLEDAAAA